MIFKFPTISVKNLDESLDFYTGILKLETAKRLSPRKGIDIAFVKDDKNNQIELIQNEFEKPSFVYEFNSVTSLSFEIDSLDKFMNFLNEKGIKLKKEPRKTPSTEFIVIEDPNGVEIALHEHLK